jgi:hypothetical protein
VLANVEHGVTRDREHQLKYRGASRRCDVCKAQRDLESGQITPGQALTRAGWDRSSEHERGVLLDIFGLVAAPPDLAACAPAPPEPQPFIPAPAVQPAGPEMLAEMDALVDPLVASWTSPKVEASAAAPEPPTPGMTPAGIFERAPSQAGARASQTPDPGDLPVRTAETELEASA